MSIIALQMDCPYLHGGKYYPSIGPFHNVSRPEHIYFKSNTSLLDQHLFSTLQYPLFTTIIQNSASLSCSKRKTSLCPVWKVWNGPIYFRLILQWYENPSLYYHCSQKLRNFYYCFFETCSYNLCNLIIQIQISLTTGNLYLACLVIQWLYNATMLQRISKRVLVLD